MRSLLLLLLLFVAACDSEESTDPVAGSWTIARTLNPPSEGCDPLDLNDLEVTIDPGADKPVACSSCDDGVGDNLVDGVIVRFDTIELAFSDTSDTVVVDHNLVLVGTELMVGVASARGDGLDLGCTWTMNVAGKRILEE
jgi:hypothetical protein